jgi:glutamine amidotransferase
MVRQAHHEGAAFPTRTNPRPEPDEGREAFAAAAMSVAIIDYGSGNLRSAAKAFERAVRDSGRAETVTVTSDAEVVARADRIVLPGVGAFADCRRGLFAVPGMVEALADAVLVRGRPFLGICVGMQLMASRGLEHGVHDGFGWIPGEVRAIEPGPARPVPHMGWNDLQLCTPQHPALAGIAPGAHAYFVHSYALVCENPAHVLATVDYGGALAALVGRNNMIGTQFHPEKSQATGLRLIANFLAWRP